MANNTSSERTAKDRNGNEYILGDELDSGAEGTVYKIVDDDAVAKVFTSPDEQLERKIIQMVSNRPTYGGNNTVFAWPTATLYHNKTFVGYKMPLLDTSRYTPLRSYIDSKLNSEAGVTVPKLRLAANLASAVYLTHEHGHAIGDFNYNNIWVTENQRVTLLDCDSFSISGDDGRVFHGTTKDQEVQAPEGRPTNKIAYTQMADNFCLAFRIFKLLVSNYPYQASGRDSKVGTVSDVVDENPFTFWYAPEGILEPANESVYRDLPHGIRILFESAFMDGKYHIYKRPSAKVWWATLLAEIDSRTDNSRSSNINFNLSWDSSSGISVQRTSSDDTYDEVSIPSVHAAQPIGDTVSVSGTIFRKGPINSFEHDGEKSYYISLDIQTVDNSNQQISISDTLRLKFWGGMALRAKRSLTKGPEIKATGTVKSGFRDDVDIELHVDEFDVKQATDHYSTHQSIARKDADNPNVHIRGKILWVGNHNTWKRDDGSKGERIDCLIADSDGHYTVSFYNSNAKRMAIARPGQTVEITNGIVERTGSRTHIVYKGSYSPPALTNIDTIFNPDTPPISGLSVGSKVDIYGDVVDAEQPRKLNSGTTVKNLVVRDDSGKISVALWDKYAKATIQEGDKLLLLNMDLVNRNYTDINDGVQAESDNQSQGYDKPFNGNTKIIKIK